MFQRYGYERWFQRISPVKNLVSYSRRHHQVDRQQAADRKGEPSLMVEMNHKLFSHLMAGVECVSGKTGHYYFQDLWTRVNQKYISKVFCSGDAEC